ncbi:MAG TPA: hypothetical protein DEP05_03550 [Betaproteobacteria bacterium]|nr:hypothetical protein [Betaproteobacteria bacterium]
MARAISDEEIKLRGKARRRLIGAIALVTLMIVFLPMVLVSRPKPAAHHVEINIPAPDSGALTGSRLIPLQPPSAKPPPAHAAAKSPAGQSTPRASKPARAPAANPTHIANVQEKPVSPAAVPAAAKPQKAAKRYAVQLAAFSNPNNAHKLQARLTLNAIQAYTEVFKTSHGKKTRVRVGPFDSRAAAEAARAKLAKIKLKGNVVTLK